MILVVGADQKMVSKRPYNWYPGLILGVLCTICRARSLGTGLGAKFGRKPAKTKITIIIFIPYLKRKSVDHWRLAAGLVNVSRDSSRVLFTGPIVSTPFSWPL